ncbi:MAG: ComF family protein [Pseudomonadota bacterium]
MLNKALHLSKAAVLKTSFLGNRSARIVSAKPLNAEAPSNAAQSAAGRVRRVFAVGGRSTIDFLTPPLCPISQEPVARPGDLSFSGWSQLTFIDAPICSSCGVPFEIAPSPSGDMICGACIAKPPDHDGARAAVAYTDASRRLIVGFKSSDRTEYAPMFAHWIARAAKTFIEDKGEIIIAPTPLHWRRLFARRYNQSALIARRLVEHPVYATAQFIPDLLKRRRATPPQKDLSVDARWRNVAGTFAVTGKYADRLKGARVLLVDDVVTSGATASACARALKRAGAAAVYVVSVARVVKSGAIAL